MTDVNIYPNISVMQCFSTESHQGRGLNMQSNQSVLLKEIDSLIGEGYTSYGSLDDLDKDRLTVLSIRLLGKNAYECITDVNDFDDIVHRLTKFINTGSIDNAIELADAMREQTTQYFSKNLSQLFDDRVVEIECSIKRENGLKPIQHKDNGETAWIRA